MVLNTECMSYKVVHFIVVQNTFSEEILYTFRHKKKRVCIVSCIFNEGRRKENPGRKYNNNRPRPYYEPVDVLILPSQKFPTFSLGELAQLPNNYSLFSAVGISPPANFRDKYNHFWKYLPNFSITFFEI